METEWYFQDFTRMAKRKGDAYLKVSDKFTVRQLNSVFTPSKFSSATHCTASDRKYLVVSLQHHDYLVQIQDWKLICERMWEAAERRKTRGKKRGTKPRSLISSYTRWMFSDYYPDHNALPSNAFSLMTKRAPAILKLTAHQLPASFGQLI